MKTYNKLLLSLAVGSCIALAGCQKDETLNLETYPENKSSIAIDGTENKASEVTLNATYNSEGALEFDGPLTRTYTFHFNASPKEATVTFEPLSNGIPKDVLELSTSKVTVPAGFTDASVTLNIKDGQLDFMRSDYDVATYELGVKAAIEGYEMPADTLKAKILIKKEAYVATCFLEGKDGGSTASYERVANGSQIMNPDSISYVFNVQLDRPARKDVKIKLTTTGLDDKYMTDITTTPAEIVIPAGKVSSGDITWSISNDFLLRESGALSDTLMVASAMECEDSVVKQDEQKNSFTLVVDKVLRYFEYLSAKPAAWTELDGGSKTGWSVETNVGKDGSVIIDGKGGPSAPDLYTGSQLTFTVDMQSEKTFDGIGVDYCDNWGQASSPKTMRISTSSDGVSWTDQGVANTPQAYYHYFRFFSPVEARYVKFDLNGIYNSYYDVTEVYIYK